MKSYCIKSFAIYTAIMLCSVLKLHSQHHDTLKINNFEIPEIKHGEEVIHHSGYSFVYSEKHEQSKWVAYELTSNETEKAVERSNDFITDPKVKTGSADNPDYAGSGYDRGHLAPAADMGWSEQTMKESFYFSNMSPQVPSFNRGIWKKLETQVRTWAIENEAIYVVTGPILKDGLKTIGPNKVSVPEYYFKVILDLTGSEKKAIGFVLPNSTSTLPLSEFAISVDSVETLTAINFFPKLENTEEEKLESSICIECWSWKKTKIKDSQVQNKEVVTKESAQCKGITSSGVRCKKKTKSKSGYCNLHKK